MTKENSKNQKKIKENAKKFGKISDRLGHPQLIIQWDSSTKISDKWSVTKAKEDTCPGRFRRKNPIRHYPQVTQLVQSLYLYKQCNDYSLYLRLVLWKNGEHFIPVDCIGNLFLAKITLILRRLLLQTSFLVRDWLFFVFSSLQNMLYTLPPYSRGDNCTNYED